MIDEAIGKILGMAMAYGVSVLGLFLAYVNYRKRIVKAERIMTGTAWTVVVVTLLVIASGVLVVARLAQSSAAELPLVEPVATPVAIEPPPAEPAPSEVDVAPERRRWSWIGIAIPAAIFLLATIVTTALHRHFSTQHAGP